MDELQQFRATYIAECFELLEDMETRLLQLEPGSSDKEALNAIFRCAHSIKGGAGVFGFTQIGHFTHIFEALLDLVRDDVIPVTTDIIDASLTARDALYQMICSARDNLPIDALFGQEIIVRLQSFHTSLSSNEKPATADAKAATIAEDKQCYHIEFKPHESMIASGSEPLLMLRELAGLGEISVTCNYSALPPLDSIRCDSAYFCWQITLVTTAPVSAIEEVFEFVEDECELSITLQQEFLPEATSVSVSSDSPVSAAAEKPSAQNVGTASIRVDIDKVDALINMVGEVVIAQAYLSSKIRKLPRHEHLDIISGNEEMVHRIRDLQEAVMAVRMQPVRSIFSRMPRLVRDLSSQLGKDIRLVMKGEQTEVDKTIIEQLSDPLTHMIRNSADHGIESPKQREAAGKSRRGTITLSAEHRGGRIMIEIDDDGNGINREKVLAKAIEKQIVATDQTLSAGEIDMLIFAPGFSTAENVSSVSGRGVGMDVVKRNIEQIGGLVQVENRPGEGATFTIALPLTLAILDGMIIRIGQEYYVIPINYLVEAIRPEGHSIRSVAGSNDVINIRGAFLPIYILSELLGVPDANRDPEAGMLIIVEDGDQQCAILVDELIEQQQVVIKTLEDNADAVDGIAGATILGDGKVSLIIDIARLPKLNQRWHSKRTKMKQAALLDAA